MTDRIWAPWRINYIRKTKQKSCIFCDAAKAKDDKKKFVLLRGKYCYIILNTFPYNNGHLMVAPFSHKASLRLLNSVEISEMFDLAKKAQNILDKALKPHGFNLGINEGRVAGAGFAGHVHLHIVPRWNGDTNFMPVTAQTKVIAQSLEALYIKLKDNL